MRFSKLGGERPDHAKGDDYPICANMKNPPYACVECVNPCDEITFLFTRSKDIDCASRHSGKE